MNPHNKRNPTAIEAMSEALKTTLQAQQDCLDNEGLYVKSGFRYRYALLIEKASELRQSIRWLQDMYKSNL